MNDITFTMHLNLLSFWDTFQLDIFLGHDLFWYSYSRSTIRQTHTLRMFWIIFDQFPGATPKNCGNQLIKPSTLDIDMYYEELHIIWTCDDLKFFKMHSNTCVHLHVIITDFETILYTDGLQRQWSSTHFTALPKIKSVCISISRIFSILVQMN